MLNQRIKSAYRKERVLPKITGFAFVILSALFAFAAMAQDAAQTETELTSEEKTAIIREFSRTAQMDGIILNFVLLNNKTVDLLFAGSGKYAMRARANAATIFYVQGTPEKDIKLDPQFVVEQGGKSFKGKAINMKNLEAGSVPKGSQISGLVQLAEKIDVTQPFVIKGTGDAAAEFKLSEKAIGLMAN